MAETALVALVPELEPLVGSFRRTSAEDAARGMPPHVTLLYPFIDDQAVDEVVPAVERVLATFAPFEVSFSSVERWPDTLYLEPEPADVFVRMTRALVLAFPEYPPYGGAHDEIVPHLTVAHGDAAQFDAIERELGPSLPVRVRVERVWLMADEAEGWRRRAAFPLEPL